jgi:hypothetical protein
MLSKYITNIYKEYINPALLGDELLYSELIKNLYLDLWNNCTHIGKNKSDLDRLFYVKDNIIWFQIYYHKSDNLNYIYIYKEPYDILLNHGLQYKEIKQLFDQIFPSDNIPKIVLDTIDEINPANIQSDNINENILLNNANGGVGFSSYYCAFRDSYSFTGGRLSILREYESLQSRANNVKI